MRNLRLSRCNSVETAGMPTWKAALILHPAYENSRLEGIARTIVLLSSSSRRRIRNALSNAPILSAAVQN